MTDTCDVQTCERLRSRIRDAELHYNRPPSRYDAGQTLEFDITGVCPAFEGRAVLEVQKFVGGGFAGQVYKATLRELALEGCAIPGLEVGGTYAVKILIPPSRFSTMFRNAIFRLGYQGPFSPQVLRSAARTGALWQKLARRAAAIRFNDERAVKDMYATFYDDAQGSYGEITEWVEGRNWRFEIDEHITKRRRAATIDASSSQEYLAKKRFMADFVQLLHDMGAPELARQYEWWTCKSQPNVLKRTDEKAGDGPADGLTALDFRAGLALLPFLPMSPGDFVLILRGLRHGRLVQFDRGDLEKLEAYCHYRGDQFEDLLPALEELKQVDPEYRASLPDITHHGLKPLWNKALRRGIKQGIVQGWEARKLCDPPKAQKLRKGFFGFWMFALLSLIPLAGPRFMRLFGNAAYRKHIGAALTSPKYLSRALRGRQAHALLDWYRNGRVGPKRLETYLRHPALYWFVRFIPGILPLPPKWHRFITEGGYAWECIRETVTYPIRFYRDADFRQQWLTDEIEDGAAKGMLTDAEHQHILSRISDDYIQKYLKCVAVHVCTVPVTQVMSVIIAAYAAYRFGKSWEESLAYAAGVLGAFQLLIVSPGSLVRGLYVVYLMIKERNFHNYRIAVFVSFLHYVGYLGFPLQMVAEFPALARFMAGRWATKMVNIVPVFGERGALLEHWIFDLFFNVPLTMRRAYADRRARKRKRAEG